MSKRIFEHTSQGHLVECVSASSIESQWKCLNCKIGWVEREGLQEKEEEKKESFADLANEDIKTLSDEEIQAQITDDCHRNNPPVKELDFQEVMTMLRETEKKRRKNNSTPFLIDCGMCMIYNLALYSGIFYAIQFHGWSNWSLLLICLGASPSKELK